MEPGSPRAVNLDCRCCGRPYEPPGTWHAVTGDDWLGLCPPCFADLLREGDARGDTCAESPYSGEEYTRS